MRAGEKTLFRRRSEGIIFISFSWSRQFNRQHRKKNIYIYVHEVNDTPDSATRAWDSGHNKDGRADLTETRFGTNVWPQKEPAKHERTRAEKERRGDERARGFRRNSYGQKENDVPGRTRLARRRTDGRSKDRSRRRRVGRVRWSAEKSGRRIASQGRKQTRRANE